MILPKMPNKIQQRQSQVLKLGGINFSDDYTDGTLSECKNISTRRYPYFSTRRGRTKLDDYENASSITSWNKLVVVEGTNLKYDGQVVGTVTEGVKQFAVINTKLVIMPDKKYLDLNELTLKPMGASFTNTVTAGQQNVQFHARTDNTDQYVSFERQHGSLTSIFNVGDGVVISGCTNHPENNITTTISKVQSNRIYFSKIKEKDFVTGGESVAVTFSRQIPDFDFICSSNNRIWGCVNNSQTIYASALGDPTNFYDYSGESTDSYAVAVGSPGEFTGCIGLGTSVLFFKNDLLHKVLGDYPSNYALYTYNIEGVLKGCEKSMQIINETLIYVSAHGVFTYAGGNTNYISKALGDDMYTDAVAGTDGEKYYLSCKDKDNNQRLFVYDIKNSIWLQEDDTEAVQFTRFDKNLYMLDSDGDICIMDSREDEPDIEWVMQFKPFYERSSSSNSIFNKKKYFKVFMRVDIPKGSYANVKVRCDGDRWSDGTYILGRKENVFSVVIPINRCDKFELRLEGKGPFTLLGMDKVYSLGSERE